MAGARQSAADSARQVATKQVHVPLRAMGSVYADRGVEKKAEQKEKGRAEARPFLVLRSRPFYGVWVLV